MASKSTSTYYHKGEQQFLVFGKKINFRWTLAVKFDDFLVCLTIFLNSRQLQLF
jgi:hypothetical protein